MTVIDFVNPFKENATDPTGNREDALDLAAKIEAYYHRSGYPWVNVKVITFPIYSGNGDRIGSRYELESNIKFSTEKYLAKSSS